MPRSVFLTGATGYVGGDFLYAFAQAHPDWNISALVRNVGKVAILSKVYPKVRTVNGDLDSAEVSEEEVKNADIKSPTATMWAANAISKGAAHHTSDRPCWLIHASGTASFIFEDGREKTYGIERTQKLLGWNPTRPSLLGEIPGVIEG